MHSQPPTPDGNAYTHLNWLPAKDTDEDTSGRGAITPRLRALSDLKAKLKIEMCNHKDWAVPKQAQGITTLQLLEGSWNFGQ